MNDAIDPAKKVSVEKKKRAVGGFEPASPNSQCSDSATAHHFWPSWVVGNACYPHNMPHQVLNHPTPSSILVVSRTP